MPGKHVCKPPEEHNLADSHLLSQVAESGSMSKKPNEDARFRRVQKDPRFWEMPDREKKVQIDKRFQAMFKDKRFQVKQTVDKRGRPVNHTAKEDLRRFYNLSESEGEEEEEPGKKKVAVKTGGPSKEAEDEEGEEDDSELEGGSADEEESSEEESGSDSGSEDDSEPDLARGVGNVETSSDEDDEEEDEVESLLRREEEEIQHDWGDLCKDAPRGEEVWPRLAVCNLDWDRLKAKDLLALFNSFKPAGGVVLSVKIYPSEFGKERLQMEQSQGPLELLVSLPEDPEKDSEEEKVHREKLRDYQFKRLRFFFAVVECDSAETAAKLYSECDGFEYESSSSILDLRFIPDDVVFDEEPKEVATEVELTTYTPKLFTSSAAATSKVEVTWDETDHDRIQALNRHFNKSDLMDMDFNAYLASSSEEEEEQEEEQSGALEPEEKTEDKPAGGQREVPPVEEEEEDNRRRRKNKKKSGEEQIARYRELLKGIQQKESQQRGDNEMEMEVSWVPGLRETTERLVKKKMEVQEQRTPWEDYLEKKRERRKQRRNQEGEAESNLADEDDEDDVPSDVDLNDPYFAEELGASAGVKKKPTKKKEEESSEEDEELEKRKAEMSLLMGDDEDEKHNHFNFEKIVELQNLSKKKKKKLQKKSQEDLPKDNFQVDVADPRFQAVFTSHLFNLDPSDPNFRKTRGTDTIVAEKLRRRAQQDTHRRRKQEVPTQIQEAVAGSAGGGAEKKSLDPSLSLLVKSVKNKTQQFQASKKPRLM